MQSNWSHSRALACHAKPLTAGASSALDWFMRSAFIETADKTSQNNYRPIVVVKDQ